MAEENGRLVELVTELFVRVDRTNEILNGVKEKLSSVDSRFEKLDSRVERLEKHQATTNLLLQQNGRDIVKLNEGIQKTNKILEEHSSLLRKHSEQLKKIEEFLSEQVPHWGQSITIETQTGPFTGWLRKTG